LTHESSSNLVFRRLDLPNDLIALAGLLNDVEEADQTGEQVAEDTLREQLTWSGQDPALNSWVVVTPDDSSLIGYGMIQKTAHDPNADVYVAVHPSWKRQGIGSQLFTRLLARASELQARALRAYVHVQNEGAKSFVGAQEFAEVSTFTRFSLTGMPRFPALSLPAGFSVRSYDQIERVDLYTDALNRSYAGYWGHLQTTPEELAEFIRHLNPAGIFLLFAPSGAIAGTCRAERSDRLSQERGAVTALIDAPGIVAEYREADLAVPLLLTAIHWLLSERPQILELEAWGEAPSTLARYRALGFTVTKEEISYRRDLE
jgi:mycothiol synthase